MTALAVQVVHQWSQRLPLKDQTLICISCGQVKPLAGVSEVLSCAAVAAWQHYGSRANGDFWIVPLRRGQ